MIRIDDAIILTQTEYDANRTTFEPYPARVGVLLQIKEGDTLELLRYVVVAQGNRDIPNKKRLTKLLTEWYNNAGPASARCWPIRAEYLGDTSRTWVEQNGT